MLKRLVGLCAVWSVCVAAGTLERFDMEAYPQDVSYWLNPQVSADTTPLMAVDLQHKHHAVFLSHWFGTHSPWHAAWVQTHLQSQSSEHPQQLVKQWLAQYNNALRSPDAQGLGENFHPHDAAWLKAIQDNIAPDRMQALAYHAEQRAIAIDNLALRFLPTNDVFLQEPHHSGSGGHGYPFDGLQNSAVWAGTPVYRVMRTLDQAWSFVITPSGAGWVVSQGLADVDDAFVTRWTRAAYHDLAAITTTRAPVMEDEHAHFLFPAYVGSVFPVASGSDDDTLRLMVPVITAQRQAAVAHARMQPSHAVRTPWPLNEAHLHRVISTLIGRPYGWGNLYFYNDCSSELKSLFTPFGVWLPRFSKDQIRTHRMVDLTDQTPLERLRYVSKHGDPYLSLLYFEGHVMLYAGHDPVRRVEDFPAPMTYQNLWGLKTQLPGQYALIGRSSFFPLLLDYPEQPDGVSMANRQYFRISFLKDLLEEPGASEPSSLKARR